VVPQRGGLCVRPITPHHEEQLVTKCHTEPGVDLREKKYQETGDIFRKVLEWSNQGEFDGQGM
jgi:hypothetical protein